MSLATRISPADPSHVLFILTGRFTFDLHREVADAVKTVGHEIKRVTVDLRDAEYVDSAALGMLIQIRAKLAPRDITLKLKKDSVAQSVLSIANFDKLFPIELT